MIKNKEILEGSPDGEAWDWANWLVLQFLAWVAESEATPVPKREWQTLGMTESETGGLQVCVKIHPNLWLTPGPCMPQANAEVKLREDLNWGLHSAQQVCSLNATSPLFLKQQNSIQSLDNTTLTTPRTRSKVTPHTKYRNTVTHYQDKSWSSQVKSKMMRILELDFKAPVLSALNDTK